MTDHAHELRRHARKIPHPQGETPGVMLRAADEIERLRAKITEMEKQVPICRAEDIRHAEGLLPSLGLKPEDNLYALPGAQPAPSLASGDVSLISEGKTQPAPSVPDGWKLVPTEPTKEMRAAWDSSPICEDDDAEFRRAYSEMLAAAPEAKP